MNWIKKSIVKFLLKNKDKNACLEFPKEKYVYEKNSFNVFVYIKNSDYYYSLQEFELYGCHVNVYDKYLHNSSKTRKFCSWESIFDNCELVKIIKIYKGSVSENKRLKGGRLENYNGFIEYIFGEWFFLRTWYGNGLQQWFRKAVSSLASNKKRNTDDVYRLREQIMKEFHKGCIRFSTLDLAKLLYPVQFKYPTPNTYNIHSEYVEILINTLVFHDDLEVDPNGRVCPYRIKNLPMYMSTFSHEESRLKWGSRLTKAIFIATFLAIPATSGMFNSMGSYADSKIAQFLGIDKKN